MREFLRSIASFFIRISAFTTKEYSTALSQPSLVGVLILGPFLILLLLGISYREVNRILRTAVVVPVDSGLEDTIQQYGQQPEYSMQIVDITTDMGEAIDSLRHKAVDIVIVVPDEIEATINSNEHPIIKFYHQEVDPFEVAFVRIMAARITDGINTQLMLGSVEESKAVARKYKEDVQALETSAGQDSATDPNTRLLLALLGLAANQAGVETSAGSGQESRPVSVDAQVEKYLETDSSVIVEPFRQETSTLGVGDVEPADYYYLVVIALLLQHIAISLGGLSIVSERLAGTTELMRAAPVNPVEGLLGKYLSLTVLLGLISAALTALAVYVLKVPMAGSPGLYAAILSLVTMVSLGLGFFISNVVRSDSQAIQLAMVLLLATIFFSGVFIPLYRLWWPAQVLSWAMPATYGINMLQDAMLRGIPPAAWMFYVLGGAGVVLFFLNWILLRRWMAQV